MFVELVNIDSGSQPSQLLSQIIGLRVEPPVCESTRSQLEAYYVRSLCLSLLLCDMSPNNTCRVLGGLNDSPCKARGTIPSTQMELRCQLVSFCGCGCTLFTFPVFLLSHTLLINNTDSTSIFRVPAQAVTALGSLLAFSDADTSTMSCNKAWHLNDRSCHQFPGRHRGERQSSWAEVGRAG